MKQSYNNTWLSLKRARIIAQDLKNEFLGTNALPDQILSGMWCHPLYEDQMWLDVDWNNDDIVIGIHVGIAGGIIM